MNEIPQDMSTEGVPEVEQASFEEQVAAAGRRLDAERIAVAIDAATKVYDEVLLRVGPPPGWSTQERTGEDTPRAFELSDDQLCALRELLALVHYDDLANSWLMLLPSEFFPRGRGEQR